MRSDLLALAATLSARDERFALVTVVRREPPSSARVGDSALITEAGDYHGWAGGGCTREVIVRESLRAIADGEPRLLSLSPSHSSGSAGEVSTMVRPGMQLLPMACDSGGTVEIYVEPVLPVPRLVLFGATPTVDALAGDAELFARMDYVEEAWRIVDPVLMMSHPVREYEPGTWGPPALAQDIVPPGGWANSSTEEGATMHG